MRVYDATEAAELVACYFDALGTFLADGTLRPNASQQVVELGVQGYRQAAADLRDRKPLAMDVLLHALHAVPSEARKTRTPCERGAFVRGVVEQVCNMAVTQGWAENADRWRGFRLGLALVSGMVESTDRDLSRLLAEVNERLPGGDSFVMAGGDPKGGDDAGA